MAKGSFVTTGLAEAEFSPGDIIMAQGKTSDRVYLLKSGTVAVEIDGTEVCQIGEPQSIFGEICALLACPHTATVKASTECVFYVIGDLRTYCKTNPEAAVYIAEILAQRLVNMNQRFTQFKAELSSLDALSKDLSFAKQISNLVLRMDRFWGRDVFETKPRKK